MRITKDMYLKRTREVWDKLTEYEDGPEHQPKGIHVADDIGHRRRRSSSHGA